jgi:hypothetical protein
LDGIVDTGVLSSGDPCDFEQYCPTNGLQNTVGLQIPICLLYLFKTFGIVGPKFFKTELEKYSVLF